MNSDAMRCKIDFLDAKCLDGWTYNPDTFKCYKFIQKKATWSEGKQVNKILYGGISTGKDQGTINEG